MNRCSGARPGRVNSRESVAAGCRRRRLLLASLVPLLVLLATAGARAAQKDPRLAGLFARLHSAPNALVARDLERRIWLIWSDSGDRRANTLYAAGLRAMTSGHLINAVGDFTRAVREAPDFAEAWNKLATVYWMLHDDSASLRAVRRTLELDPRHFGAWTGLGMILEARGEPRQALRAFEHAVRLDPYAPGARQAVRRLRRRLYGQSL